MIVSSRQRTTRSALLESVAWLEHLTLEMTTRSNSRHSLGKRNVLYELQMTYQPSNEDEPTMWTLSRTFDEYRELRRRLLKVLQLGHRCNADCKGLGNVFKHHFPQASFLCRSRCSEVEGISVTLLQILNTIKASLVNHGNLGCSKMRDNVSKVFTVFVSGSNDKDLLRVFLFTASSFSVSFSSFNFKRSSSFTLDEEIQEVKLECDDFSCGNLHVSRFCRACKFT